MRSSPFLLGSLLLAPLLIAAAPPTDQSLHYVLDAAHSDIRAKVALLGIASKTARFPNASGHIALDPSDLEAIKLDVTLDAKALTADDKLTVSQLKGRKFFDAEHYPQLRFIGQRFTMTGEKSAKLTGQVIARGITREETLDITFSQSPASASLDQPIRLSATMALNRDDFGMTAYHVFVGRNVTILIDATMVPA